MASATGSHPDTGSSVRPLPGSSTTIRPAGGRRFSAPKIPLLTERGFGSGCTSGGAVEQIRSGCDPTGPSGITRRCDYVRHGRERRLVRRVRGTGLRAF